MLHNIGRVVDKPTDYKECTKCSAINWFDNEKCHACNGTLIGSPILDPYCTAVRGIKDQMADGDVSYNTQIEVA